MADRIADLRAHHPRQWGSCWDNSGRSWRVSRAGWTGWTRWRRRYTVPAWGDVATIMWLGYDAPDTIPEAAFDGSAEQGGALLDSFVDGLHASHDTGRTHITAVGHSYGSVVVGEAAVPGDGPHAGDIVVAGSPGMHTDHDRREH
jgi:hypothetical protein